LTCFRILNPECALITHPLRRVLPANDIIVVEEFNESYSQRSIHESDSFSFRPSSSSSATLTFEDEDDLLLSQNRPLSTLNASYVNLFNLDNDEENLKLSFTPPSSTHASEANVVRHYCKKPDGLDSGKNESDD
jgi:hypothetical protein